MQHVYFNVLHKKLGCKRERTLKFLRKAGAFALGPGFFVAASAKGSLAENTRSREKPGKELIYQLRKKRSQWDTTDISLQKGTSKKERRPAGQRSENCKNLLGDLGSHAGEGSCACRRSTLTVRFVWRKTPAVP